MKTRTIRAFLSLAVGISPLTFGADVEVILDGTNSSNAFVVRDPASNAVLSVRSHGCVDAHGHAISNAFFQGDGRGLSNVASDACVRKTGDAMTGALRIDARSESVLLIGSSGTNIAIGAEANASSGSTAVGRRAISHDESVAVGLGANGSVAGVSVGAPGGKVCWEVKALRSDPAWLEDLTRRPVEQSLSELAPGQAEAENEAVNAGPQAGPPACPAAVDRQMRVPWPPARAEDGAQGTARPTSKMRAAAADRGKGRIRRGRAS